LGLFTLQAKESNEGNSGVKGKKEGKKFKIFSKSNLIVLDSNHNFLID